MAELAPFLVIIWVLVALALFAHVSRPNAVVLICLLGTLFLPEIQSSPVARDAIKPIRVSLLEFSKVNSISYGLLLGLLVFDASRLIQIRWNLFDLPVVLLAVMPAISTLLNGSGAVEAFAEFRTSFLFWTVPYIVGRVYLSDYWGVRLVTTAIAVGGLIYTPFCLYEFRMSPTLHYRLFGFQQHDIRQMVRDGSYRPMVFMQHGLAVGLWMVNASLCLFWLWYTNGWPTLRTPAFIRRIPGLTLLAQVITTSLSKSLGALILGAVGAVTLFISSRFRTRLLLVFLILLPPAYLGSRLMGWWHAEDFLTPVKSGVEEERSQSLEFRLFNEDKLMKICARSPLVGMGGGPDSRPKDEKDRPIIPDSQWIITYYDTGLVGLAALLVLFLGPAARFVMLHPPATWRLAQIGPATVAAVVVIIIVCDCLMNAMLNPVYLLLVAALNGWNNGVRDPQSQAALRYLEQAAMTSR